MKTAQISRKKNFYVDSKLKRTRRKSPRRAFDASKFADFNFSGILHCVYKQRFKSKGPILVVNFLRLCDGTFDILKESEALLLFEY